MACKLRFECPVCLLPIKGRTLNRHLRKQHDHELKPGAFRGIRRLAKEYRREQRLQERLHPWRRWKQWQTWTADGWCTVWSRWSDLKAVTLQFSGAVVDP